MLLLPLSVAPLVAAATGLQLALDQPFFPGKIILWLLFMLSLMSWAVMASKIVSLRRFQEGDRNFTDQLRRSKKPLELHEKGWNDPMSLRQEVYDAGAKEAAFQLLGAARRGHPGSGFESLSDSQIMILREALIRGVNAAEARLNIGMPVLQAAAAGAPFLGLLGMVWIMMNSFGGEATPADVSNGISASLAVMAIGLIAATPAIFGQIFLRSTCRARLQELGDFRLELSRLFERSLATIWNPERPKAAAAPMQEASAPAKHATLPATQPVAKPAAQPQPLQQTQPSPSSQSQPLSPQPQPYPQQATARPTQGVKTKVFKSIRQDEPMINPIAMQTKGLRPQS